MNLFVETYWISIVLQMLGIAAFTAVLIGLNFWNFLVDQFQWPRKPFLCPLCLGFWHNLMLWSGVAYETSLTFLWAVTISLIGGVMTELIDQKINFMHE